MNYNEIAKECYETAESRGVFDCHECGGNAEVKNPKAEIEGELAVIGRHSLKEDLLIQCPTCNGTGIRPDIIEYQTMVIIGEIHEAWQAFENNKDADWSGFREFLVFLPKSSIDREYIKNGSLLLNREEVCKKFNFTIKNTKGDKLADIVISCLTLNNTHTFKIYTDLECPVVKEQTEAEFFLDLHYRVSTKRMGCIIGLVFAFAKHHSIDLDRHIKAKMEYNKIREVKS